MLEIYLLKIVLAHVIGDFFLQPNSWVKDKEKRKLRSDKLYLHVAIHVVVLFLLFADLTLWKPIVFIGLMHFIIDSIKLLLQNKGTAKYWFFGDQALHLLSIGIGWYWFFDGSFTLDFINTANFWMLALGVVFLTTPTAIIMRVIIAKWIPKVKDGQQSLQNAGQYIGILERLLIFLFISTNHFEAVGFLLAAKSIFRFGDLKESNDIKLTEYVLIGTLLSFGFAIVTALTIQQLLG